ncbi:MAG: ABC transporter ATP-binding protein [Christensenella sp.]|nr:ABC transporter ATP-binding protein [Christensenella sp.]
MAPYVQFENVAKVYRTEGEAVHALRDVNFSIEQGEVCVIVGQSGAGKTTLLNILGGMDTLTSGKAFLGGEEISAYSKRQLTRCRREDVGFVFQFYNLIPNLTALENVEMATELAKTPFSAAETLKDVGLGERMNNFPAQLSGGEQQRVAIARALAKNPKLLLCDEPTGALDDSTGKQVLKVLSDLGRVKGKTVVIITHNSAITQMADRVVRVKNGTVVSVQRNEHPKSVEEIDW